MISSSTSSRRGRAGRTRRARPARITDGLVHDVACSVTDRDREILRLIRWHRVLTTNQVATMFFSDKNTAQHRLTRLYELRLVERFRPFRSGREGEYHYVLDQLGAYIVAAMRSDDFDAEVKVRWRTDQALAIAQSQRLAPTVGANDSSSGSLAQRGTVPTHGSRRGGVSTTASRVSAASSTRMGWACGPKATIQ